MGKFDWVPTVKNMSIAPFNGAYYTKDGNIRNLDGKIGPGANGSKLMPFTGVFIGSDGKPHDIDEIFERLGGGGSDEGLRNKATLLRADPTKFQISRIIIAEAGIGYTPNDILTLSSNGEDIPLTVATVDSQGQITGINYTLLISEMDVTSNGIVIFATGGTGNTAGFIIETAYAHGDENIQGILGAVPDGDPLIQYSMLIGYITERLNQYFPITTENIADQAITAAKIDNSAIYPGDGIQITKDETGIQISTIPADYQGITITFINIDQNGDPI